MKQIDLKLVKAERRAKWFDYASIFLFLALMLLITFAAYRSGLLKISPLVNGVLSLLAGAVLSHQVSKEFNTYGKHHWFPSYYIDVQPEILRVVGSVGLGDGEWDFVKTKLVRMRPDFRIENDAYGKFGCMMAAVPASDGFLKVRDDAKSEGVTFH